MVTNLYVSDGNLSFQVALDVVPDTNKERTDMRVRGAFPKGVPKIAPKKKSLKGKIDYVLPKKRFFHHPVQIRNVPDPFLMSRVNSNRRFSPRNIGFPF